MSHAAIKTVRVSGLHGHQSMWVRLHPKLNIIHGPNGSGKTTLLHVLANLYDCDLRRFFHLTFDKIEVAFHNGSTVTIARQSPERLIHVNLNNDFVAVCSDSRDDGSPLQLAEVELATRLGSNATYLPAFRSVLEGASSRLASHEYRFLGSDAELEYRRVLQRLTDGATGRPSEVAAEPVRQRRLEAIAAKTAQCRHWFGSFVPVVRYPSLADVSDELSRELRQANDEIANLDREAFSTLVVDIVQSVMSGTTEEADLIQVMDSIRSHLDQFRAGESTLPPIYSDLETIMEQTASSTENEKLVVRVLTLYNDALKMRASALTQTYARLRAFRNSVNAFLLGKELAYAVRPAPSRSGAVKIKLGSGKYVGLNSLSSGERHAVTLLFAATHMTEADGILLLDEPELSFHVEWQRVILDEIMRQSGDRQIIVCSHAPEVMAKHRWAMVPLRTTSDDGTIFDDLPGASPNSGTPVE